MPARPNAPAPLRALLAVQFVTTAGTAATLVAAPSLIPASFGLTLTKDAFLLCWFYAASEAGLALLSLRAWRADETILLSLRAWRADETIVSSLCFYFAFMHVAEAGAGLFALAQGFPRGVSANVAMHIVVAVLFLVATRRRPDPLA